jgi:hypothetical protein
MKITFNIYKYSYTHTNKNIIIIVIIIGNLYIAKFIYVMILQL